MGSKDPNKIQNKLKRREQALKAKKLKENTKRGRLQDLDLQEDDGTHRSHVWKLTELIR